MQVVLQRVTKRQWHACCHCRCVTLCKLLLLHLVRYEGICVAGTFQRSTFCKAHSQGDRKTLPRLRCIARFCQLLGSMHRES